MSCRNSRIYGEPHDARGDVGGVRRRGSCALEAFLANPAHKPKMKKELVEALSTEWVKLATPGVRGSHVLQACYGAAEQRGRENIVGALARNEAQIAATRLSLSLSLVSA